MTIDALYEAFMDIDEEGDPLDVKTPFAEDVFTFFGKGELGGYKQEEWAKQYGTYLPTWDPSQVNLAARERSLDYRDALDTLRTTQEVTDRVYTTELDTLSTSLGKELSKGREIAGRTGLRSGGLESAIQDTIATTGSKAKDFGDRTRIAREDTKNKYNSAMVDAALDFEKTERQEKEEFYDRTMAAIMRLMDTGAFDDPVEKDCAGVIGGTNIECAAMDGTCMSPEECEDVEDTQEQFYEEGEGYQCQSGEWVDNEWECAFEGTTGGTYSTPCTQEQLDRGCTPTTNTFCPSSTLFCYPEWMGGVGVVTVNECSC